MIFHDCKKSDKEIEQELVEAFAVFDRDGSGKISKEELVKALTALGAEPQSRDDVEDMIRAADCDKDGEIDIHGKVLSIQYAFRNNHRSQSVDVGKYTPK